MANAYGIVAADLYKYGLPQTAVIGVDPATLQAEIDASCGWADSKMRGRYQLPILGSSAGVGIFDLSIVMFICYHAAFNILCARGFNPDGGADTVYETRYKQACEWFDGVQRQRVHPDVIESPTAGKNYQLPTVNTQPKRGW